ncbi:MAG: amidohydrolase family protein [Saprospiraceae bacterium]|nr:amidohydrolase family protein [Saprospiraceae bacterium]
MRKILMLLLACQAMSLPAQTVVIRNVTLIPMDGDYTRSQQTVVLEKGLIRQMGDADQIAVPKRAQVIDGTGKFLMPGLMDMHAHFFTEQGISPAMLPQEAKLMLANGVTTARIMCGDSVYLNLKKQIARGKTPGPELFVACPQLVGKWPFPVPFVGEIIETPAEAAASVRRFHKAGYDAIKITYFVQPGPYEAVVQTARALGMPLTGHVGPDIGLARALAAGQQIEHFDEFLEQLLPDSARQRTSVSGTGLWEKEKAWPTVALLDESKIPALVQQVKAAGIAVTPTNHFLHSSFGTGMPEDSIRRLPDLDYIPASLLPERWNVRGYFWNQPPPAALGKRYVAIRQHLTRALHSAQVPLLCGSDSPEWFGVQGFALHRELQAFVEAGLTPFAALETATVNPARYLGIDKRKGSIAVGLEADLLLLDANPMEDIANTRRIAGVFRQGQYLSRADLDRLLQEARVLAKQ